MIMKVLKPCSLEIIAFILVQKENEIVLNDYERTKFDLYKDNICLFLTLTYVLMDNFLSLF